MKKEFFAENRKKVGDFLENDSIALFFSGNEMPKSTHSVFPFSVDRNFYYLTGLNESGIALLLSKRNGEVTETLFLKKSDPVMEKWVGKPLSEEQGTELSGIEKVDFIDGLRQFLAVQFFKYDFKNIYLDLQRPSWDGENTVAMDFVSEIKEKYPFLSIKNIGREIGQMRSVKKPEEVVCLKDSIDVTKNGIEMIMQKVKPGMLENKLEAWFDYVLKKSPNTVHSFESIVAAGENATILHYQENNSIIKDGDLILLDVGAAKDQYCADISRTIPASGKFTERQKTIYDIVLNASNKVIESVKPGLPFTRLNEIAKDELAKGCMEIGLIKEEKELGEYYYHQVSHFLGLDAHDTGDRECILEEGMVFTVEPGLYIAEEKIGIRIEDNILVTKDGLEVLSKNIVKTVEEIESFFRNKK